MTTKLFLLLFFISFYAQSQIPTNIENYGAFFKVENPEFKTDTTQNFYVVFDIAKSFEDTSIPNKLIESAARYIRIHRAAGIPNKSIKVALVIHGSAIFDLLTHKEYQALRDSKNPVNPNYDLISALSIEGVEIILCGQTAGYRKIDKTQLHPDVKLALSAMTALVQLQNEGYRLINF
ncbi:MAG: sulfur reduction protein DsrE [Bacteroidetes bacterium HGW-Bacteroidetes-2]|jgi:intracellular sulfur oxidation DsrE/DsrF family protein|nr:MAG: sulfur reduction protein DsrE [Bacteroidetes bacterium HGW-Bacteroidetes-2]